MPIDFVRVQYVKRSSGRSAVAVAAYQGRDRLLDERTGIVYDFHGQGRLDEHLIQLPEGAAEYFRTASQLWNAAEQTEVRKNSVTAKVMVIALPIELDKAESVELATSFVDKYVVSQGIAAQIDFHLEPDNPHCHVEMTTRRLEGDRFSSHKARDLDQSMRVGPHGVFVSEGTRWNQRWREHQGEYFREHKLDLIVDPQSVHLSNQNFGPKRNWKSNQQDILDQRDKLNAALARHPQLAYEALRRTQQHFDERALERFLDKRRVVEQAERDEIRQSIVALRRAELSRGFEREMRSYFDALGRDGAIEAHAAGMAQSDIVTGMVGIARVKIDGDKWVPDPDGKRAFITPIHASHRDDPFSTQKDRVIDLVAWHPARPERFATRTGAANDVLHGGALDWLVARRRDAVAQRLDAEMRGYFDALGRMGAIEANDLGVPKSDVMGGMIGVARAKMEDGKWTPDPQGERVFVTPVRIEHNTSPFDVSSPKPAETVRKGEMIDLVAWDPKQPDRFATRTGEAIALGSVGTARETLKVHSTPLAWLRSGGEGVVLLTDIPTEQRFVLDLAERVSIKDSKLRNELQRAHVDAIKMEKTKEEKMLGHNDRTTPADALYARFKNEHAIAKGERSAAEQRVYDQFANYREQLRGFYDLRREQNKLDIRQPSHVDRQNARELLNAEQRGDRVDANRRRAIQLAVVRKEHQLPTWESFLERESNRGDREAARILQQRRAREMQHGHEHGR